MTFTLSEASIVVIVLFVVGYLIAGAAVLARTVYKTQQLEGADKNNTDYHKELENKLLQKMTSIESGIASMNQNWSHTAERVIRLETQLELHIKNHDGDS